MFNSKLNRRLSAARRNFRNFDSCLCNGQQFYDGKYGKVVGKSTRSIEYATPKKLPLVIVTASGGARMQKELYL